MRRTWVMAFFIGTALIAASCGQDTAESGKAENKAVQSGSEGKISVDADASASGAASKADSGQAGTPGSGINGDQAEGSGSDASGNPAKGSGLGRTDTGEKKTSEEKQAYTVTDTRFEYYLNTIGQVEYHALVEVENTGEDPLYLQGAVFDFEDMEGHLAWTEDFISSCPNVIGPGEKGWFYNSIGASGTGSIDASAEYRFIPNLTVVKSNADPVFYETSDTSLSTNALGYPTVTGRVLNTTEKADPLVNLQVVFYGDDGKVIGISGMTMMDLGPGEQRSFEITGLDLSSSVREEVISDYKVLASKAHFQV